MEPLGHGPSIDPSVHHRWRPDEVAATAAASALSFRLDGERPCQLFLNRLVAPALGELDRRRLEDIVTRNTTIEPETRSRWLPLTAPIRHYDGRPVRPIVELQAKGVVFDAAQRPATYRGVGWRPEYYFADRDGRFRRFHPRHDAIGSCFVSEAVREYSYTLAAYPVMAGGSCEVVMPVAWGRYDGRAFDGEDLGFVVLGLPETSARGAAYYQALTALNQRGERAPMIDVLARRARAIRRMHDAGFLMPFRHFSNLSTTADGVVILHDLGDRCALLRDQLFGDHQYIAEAFTNLAFAMAPLEHLVDDAPRFLESRQTILADLELFAGATLDGYFGAGAGALGLSFSSIEDAFRLGFETRFCELRHPVAALYRQLLAASLASAAARGPGPASTGGRDAQA